MAVAESLLNVVARAAQFISKTIDDVLDIVIWPLEDFFDDIFGQKPAAKRHVQTIHDAKT